MRLRRLHLQAFGPFTDRWIDFGPGLTLLAGPNEAGKSSMLRALTALRFGIEHRSTDNFVHEHARMTLGAVVLDREGRELQLLRRKGREPTLSVVAPDGGSLPASADLELQLTGGLKRADHDLMFALDHQRLRAGGEQLLAGQGEIGAALFEASAGVHSLRTVLDRLDQQARSRLVPRGSTGSVNIALRRHREQHEALRAAQLRPAEWAALRQRADETQAALERARENRAAADLALRDLRERIAVAPLLRTLDDTRAELAALSLLPPPDEDLPRQRIALQTREHELQTARAAQQALRARLDEQLQALPAGTPRWLEQAAGIDRLVAAADGLEAARLQCRELEQQGQALDRQLEAAAQALEPGAGVQALLARRPDAAWQARMEAAAAQLQEQTRALAQHLDDLAAEPGAEAPPADLSESPAALAVQVQALQQRCDRLAPEVALLAGREALERQRAERHEMLRRTALQLGGEAMASRALTARPRLEADIDQALREREAAATRLAALAQRIDQIDEARRGRAAERAQLLAAGAVPTDDDIAEARRVRDALWRRLADGPAAPSTEDRALFAQLLDHADRLADGRSRDGERAARLQALQRSLAELDEDRAVLDMQRQALQRDLERQNRIWDETLAEAGLPRLAPQALREWQQHQARHLEAAQALQSVDEALQALDRRVQAAVAELHEALGPMPAGVVPDDAAALLGRARARLQALRERQTALEAQRSAHQAAQQRLERLARQTAQRRAAERQAHAALQALLDEDGRGVVLPEDALQALALANARRQAGERLRTLAEQRELQRQRLAQARLVETDLQERAAVLAAALAEPAPSGEALRGWIDRLAARLGEARAVEGARARLQQQRQQADERLAADSAALAAVQAQLGRLCERAGVASPELLPQREAQWQQQREAVLRLARTGAMLAEASRDDEAGLRARLACASPADESVAADPAQAVLRLERRLAEADEALEQARAADELARRALDAIDGDDRAVQAREGLEQAAATVRAELPHWMRARLAHALLAQSMQRFRERSQGPMLGAASTLFAAMTGGEFERLETEAGDDDGAPAVLQARRRGGRAIGVEAMSEGTRDQLHLALRLAALAQQRARGLLLPMVLDDVLMTSDDGRALRVLQALAEACEGDGGQIIVFTHHLHLLEPARRTLGATRLHAVAL
ncbi:MAG: AAA family ATPase [Sphaerotilus sulfidivorans]|uniref:AAA family ATPase n=1 Tax=Sphaerotilus sulfidivorans TaxID=639200 RepID=UPI003F3C289B